MLLATKLLLAFLAWLPAAQAAPAAAGAGDPLDYALLTHTLSVDLLRSGAYAPKGKNDFIFVVTLQGLLNSSEERNLDFAKRKKIPVALGTFGETSLESLAAWRADEKAKDLKQLKIDGDAIRELAARTMTEFKVPENEIMIQVEVALMLKKKKYMLLNADEQVAKVVYAPIPATKFEAALRTNQALVMEDAVGTFVRLSVSYAVPAAGSAAAKSSPPPKAK